VSPLQLASLLVAIGSCVIATGSRLVAAQLVLVAIGSHRVAIGPSSCNWSVKLQFVRVELQLVRQVAIGLAAKLQLQGLCICYTKYTWVHFSITLYIDTH
jgi:hypothetical protein